MLNRRAGPAIEFNRPGLEAQLPRYLANVEQRIAKAKAATPAAPRSRGDAGRFIPVSAKREHRHCRRSAREPGFIRAQLLSLGMVDWFLHRVYDELAGPLTDAVAPIPPK